MIYITTNCLTIVRKVCVVQDVLTVRRRLKCGKLLSNSYYIYDRIQISITSNITEASNSELNIILGSNSSNLCKANWLLIRPLHSKCYCWSFEHAIEIVCIMYSELVLIIISQKQYVLQRFSFNNNIIEIVFIIVSQF